MYGLVNLAIEEAILQRYGQKFWDLIKEECRDSIGDTDGTFISRLYYDDEVSYRLIDAAERILCSEKYGQVSQLFGEKFYELVQDSGYEGILKLLGGSLKDFLDNLDSFHTHLSTTYSRMQPPSFRCDQVSENVLILHYYSERIGLEGLVMGIVKAAARELHQLMIDISIHRLKLVDQGIDHTEFLIEINPKSRGDQGSLEEQAYEQSINNNNSTPPAAAFSYKNVEQLARAAKVDKVSPSVFAQALPFHLIFDRNLHIKQAGTSILRVIPALSTNKSIRLTEVMNILEPKCLRYKLNFDNILKYINSIYVFRPDAKQVISGGHRHLHPDYLKRLKSSSGKDGECTTGAPGATEESYVQMHDKKGQGAEDEKENRRLRETTAATVERKGVPSGGGVALRQRRDSMTGSGDTKDESARKLSRLDSRDTMPKVSPHRLGLVSSASSSGENATDDCELPEEDIDKYIVKLRGQMTYMPDKDLMLFICSPSVANLDDLNNTGLFLSDIPLHDATRDLVLLSEQFEAEYKVQKKLTMLTEQLNVMKNELEEEKKKTDRLLYSVLPPTVANEIRSNRPVPAKRFQPVTILFSGIVGFSEFCARNSDSSGAIRIVNLLNKIYTTFDVLTEPKRNPYVYKVETVGDKYMAVSGLPEACDSHARHINRLALDIFDLAKTIRLEEYTGGVRSSSSPPSESVSSSVGAQTQTSTQGRSGQQQQTTSSGASTELTRMDQCEHLRVTIGVHCGEVVTGVIGKRTPRYCLFGNTVNLTSRCETTGKKGAINVSQDVYNLCTKDPSNFDPSFEFQYRGQINMKGKSEPMGMWLLTRRGL
uniref:Guanylate cyclase soluble subunit beta-1 n=1 Tax=Aceria tosichella TaxID=561515 RepID=A0A6G1SMJ0_9ACAR